jgi:hypothetical protein
MFSRDDDTTSCGEYVGDDTEKAAFSAANKKVVVSFVIALFEDHAARELFGIERLLDEVVEQVNRSVRYEPK